MILIVDGDFAGDQNNGAATVAVAKNKIGALAPFINKGRLTQKIFFKPMIIRRRAFDCVLVGERAGMTAIHMAVAPAQSSMMHAVVHKRSL